jgi:hypothetical protein
MPAGPGGETGGPYACALLSRKVLPASVRRIIGPAGVGLAESARPTNRNSYSPGRIAPGECSTQPDCSHRG